MMENKRIAITGAAGNLGSLLAAHMAALEGIRLNLLIHKKDIPEVLKKRDNVEVHRVDLADAATLTPALVGVDTVVHFAGVLFMARPEKFLPVTNTQYFRNLLQGCREAGVKRVILISFPHVEGETTPRNPAHGNLDGHPASMHARTRLEEERLLLGFGEETGCEAVVLRLGMVYGKGILMIDAAHWFARRCLLGIWRKPTWIHLISIDDYLAATAAAALLAGIRGIYHLGDDGVQTLQQFLADCCRAWRCCRPIPMPIGMIRSAAWCFERASAIFGVRAPLTQDFITIGMCSYYGDTSRMKRELLPQLRYPTCRDGIGALL